MEKTRGKKPQTTQEDKLVYQGNPDVPFSYTLQLHVLSWGFPLLPLSGTKKSLQNKLSFQAKVS